MNTESISQTFYRYLDESFGQHQKIARRAGISQAAISRHYRRQGSPSLSFVEAILAVKAEDEKANASAQGVSNAKRSRVRRHLNTAPALAHPGK
jgi:predicted transcriptional regulator